MGRSSIVAEGMKEYTGLVNDRIQKIKRTMESIQRENSYKKLASKFVAEELTEVPEDISNNWVDQLTVKQFDEELKEAFPYIYKLVSKESVQTISPEDLATEELSADTEQHNKNEITPEDQFEAWAQDTVDRAVQVEFEDDEDESGLQYYIGKKKYGKDGSSSGAILGDILGKVFSSKKTNPKKKQ